MTTRASKSFPLRKVVATLRPLDELPGSKVVVLECGHTLASTAEDSTRCPKCWRGAPPDCDPYAAAEEGQDPDPDPFLQ
ncbi:hypothetical protein [Caldimonas brevitalea]|uniref:Uncharacterized protein n=1 Tax=Caldimonas brevitalea TaxID=413882 RepID=A0A0G3BDR1_9BURK|nr:hypothetical protein [Caldimonas brevitalea]AKJ27427.1 hypothetical protein AAW51_0736 [Caldimonas brevitalea]